MKKSLFLLFAILVSTNALAQSSKKASSANKSGGSVPLVASDADAAALELANRTLTAHGGDNFRNMKSLDIRGSVEVLTTQFPQKIPASFAMIFSDDKYRLEIVNPFQPLKQVYDGQQTTSSINGFNFPPINRLGLPLLQKLGAKDYTVKSLTAGSKKKKGFRMTSPEGYYTDFFIDDKTGQVKGYESSYDINGREVTTSVEIDRFRTVDGAVIPEKYSQRFDLGQMTVYANFNAKDILVNSKIDDNVFSIGK